MKYIHCEQGSEAWLQARAGKITASCYKDARSRTGGLTDQQALYVAAIRAGATEAEAKLAAGYKAKPTSTTLARAIAGEDVRGPGAAAITYAAKVAVERIAGRPLDGGFESWQMREGKEHEPAARNAYDVETGAVVQEVGAIATDDDLFLYSPDGLIGDDGLLEIKTLLSAEVILRVIGEGDLSDYIDQCMGGLWITGRKWIDLVLWAPALAPIGRDLTIHRLTRDESAIEALEADLLAFAGMVKAAESKLRGAANDDQIIPAEALAA